MPLVSADLEATELTLTGTADDTVVVGSSFSGIPPGLFRVGMVSSTSTTKLAAIFHAEQTTGSAGSIQGLEGFARLSHATSSVTLALGTIGNAENAGAGTAIELRGGSFGCGSTSTGPVTTGVCIFAAPTYKTGGGTWDKAVGVQVSAQTVGTVNYAVETLGTTPSKFGGTVDVGALTVAGVSAITSARAGSFSTVASTGVVSSVINNSSSDDQILINNTNSVHAYALRVPGSSSGAGPGYFVIRDNTRAAIVMRIAPTTGDAEMVGKLVVGQVTTITAGAALEVVSTTAGLLLPRMTTTQVNAIASAPNGLLVYDNVTHKFKGRANGIWVDLH